MRKVGFMYFNHENLSLYLICADFINSLYKYPLVVRTDLKKFVKELCHRDLVGYEFINNLYVRYIAICGDDSEIVLKLIRFLEEYYS